MTSLGKKVVPFLGLLLGLPFASAASDLGPFSAISPMLKYLFYFGSLSWLDPSYKGYAVKFLFFIVLMTLINSYATFLKDARARGVVSFAISFISVLFIPTDVELIAGTQYGTVAAVLLLGALPGAALWAGFKRFKGPGARAFLLLLSYLIFSVIGGIVGLSAYGDTQNSGLAGMGEWYSLIMSILLLLVIWYIGVYLAHALSGIGNKAGMGVVSNDFAKTIGAEHAAEGAIAASMKREEDLKQQQYREAGLENLLDLAEAQESNDVSGIISNVDTIITYLGEIVTGQKRFLGIARKLSSQSIEIVKKNLIRQIEVVKQNFQKVYADEVKKREAWSRVGPEIIREIETKLKDPALSVPDKEKLTAERDLLAKYIGELKESSEVFAASVGLINHFFQQIGLFFNDNRAITAVHDTLKDLKRVLADFERQINGERNALTIVERYQRKP